MTDTLPTPDDLMTALHDVPDPETGLDVVDLGLIYETHFDAETGIAHVVATFTTPACPAGGVISDAIVRRLSMVPGVVDVDLEITFDPRWTPARISAAGRELLGR